MTVRKQRGYRLVSSLRTFEIGGGFFSPLVVEETEEGALQPYEPDGRLTEGWTLVKVTNLWELR